ncbi:MAG: ABC transporter permease [Oscillospiraceae bacterium]|nr:ABC transporter permease [Oscillospiraceae bacterium]
MAKYLIKRIVTGLLSVIAVVAIVMILIYSLMDRQLIFSMDSVFTKTSNNSRTVYMYQKWEEYGYLDYVTYSDYINQLYKDGEIDDETRDAVKTIGRTEDADSELVAEYVAKFTEYYESQGYTVQRLKAITTGNKVVTGGNQQLFASKDIPVIQRLWTYLTSIITFDNIHTVEDDIGERGLTFTLYDPVYGGEKFSPAIIGNGTLHKYLLYFDNQFPYIHQNFVSINLGVSYTVNQGIDVTTTMTQAQGSYVKTTTIYPSGLTEESADDLHTATYVSGSKDASLVYVTRYTDDYTNTITRKSGMSKMGYSFVIGILATIMAYALGIPLGILMAQHKDGFIDKLGSLYIIFMIAVPSLAYIFIFKSIGGKLGFPTTFIVDSATPAYYVLPIVSLALPSVAGLMKWLRRYMIDQMNSDYVKFARAGGLSEGEIFRGHILKNAVIPIIHGIPGSILGALTGAIITERVYSVPGTGNLLTTAINRYDNSVIVGVTLFYALLSVVSLILGDILMSAVDPRINFTTKAR